MDDAALLLIWIWGCWPFLAGTRFIPGDSLGAFFPQTSFVVQALTHGRAPWWNPYEYGGLPVLADPQNMLFTPQTLIGLIARSSFNLHVFDLTTLACPLLGTIALSRYTAPYADTRALPLLGGIVFMLGGVATSRLQHVPQIVSYSLIPIQLLVVRALCRKPTAWLGLLSFLTLLASLLNLNQVMFLSAFMILPLVSYHLFFSPRRIRAASYLAVAGVLALVFALPELMAVTEYLPFSNRAEIPLGISGLYSFPLFNLASLIIPGLFGVTAQLGSQWPPTDISQDYLYIGILPCAIVILAICRLPKTQMPAAMLVPMAILWFAFAMGVNTPFYPFLFLHVPGFNAFRRPADGAFLMNLAVALSIGSFRIHLLRRLLRRARLLQAGLCATVLATILVAGVTLRRYAASLGHAADLQTVVEWAALRGLAMAAAAALPLLPGMRRMRAALLPALVLTATADLLTAGRLGPVLTASYSDNTASAQIATLYGNPHAHLPFTAELEQTIAFLHAHGSDDALHPIRVELVGGALGGTVPLVERIAVTQGYNPMLLGAYARDIGDQDLSRMEKRFSSAVPFYDDPLFRLLSVRYILTDKYASGPIASVVATIEARLQAGHTAHLLGIVGAYRIWEVSDSLPKATLHTGTEIRALPDGNSCDFGIYANTKLALTCHSTMDATLVLGDNYAPGWTACVNGKAAAVFPFAGLFRAVRIKSGTSVITMRYQAVPFLRSTSCRSARKV
jgi:hypothetical protein